MSDFSLVVNPGSSQLNEEWRLPFDVVSDTMAISRRPTISAIMQTCRTLYTEGPKHMLRDGVELSSADETEKFTAFMLAEGPSRFAYLRKLALLVDLHDGANLVRLLSHPSLALETVVLHYAEICLGRFADIALRAAILRLKTVKRLVLFEVEEEHTSSLSRLPRALEHISIHAKCRVEDTLLMLRPFSGTLQTLLIKSEPWLLNHFLDVYLPPCHFPHVQTFGIVYDESSSGLLSSSAFSEAFPALTHLQLIPTDPPTTRRRTRHPTGRKLFPQSRYPLDCAPPSWPSLAECSGGLRNVHSLRLPCTLSTLRLWQDVEADELDVLVDVLERTRLRRLCLSAELDDVGPLFATFHGLQVPPERIDMKIFVPKEATVFASAVGSRLTGAPVLPQAKLLSVLEVLLQEVAMGLLELNLYFDIPSVDRPAEKPGIRSTLAAFTHQASHTTAPSLGLACRLSEEGDDGHWQWPDLQVHQRITAYRDRDIGRDPQDDGYPFGDGEDDLIREAGSRYPSLRSMWGF
ncbi:hypothetical protein V8D89_001253 [Ganoderma adspersum]